MVTKLSKMINKGKGILSFAFIFVFLLLIVNASAAVTSIGLISPASGYQTTDSSPVFTFEPRGNITTNSINCTLLIDNSPYGEKLKLDNSEEASITANHSLSLGTHTWKISCVDPETSLNSSSRNIEIIETPDFCDDTSSGDFDVTIDDIDSGDDFTIGENMSFTVNVENNGDDDYSVYVEARLYDLTDEDEVSIVKIKKTIDEGDDVDYSIKLPVPYDVDESDDYVIQVKAYESGNEDDNCNEEAVSINLNRESNMVVLSKAYSSSNQVDCNSFFDFTAKVANAGEEDEENVKFKIYNSELGIDTSKTFDLDSGDTETMYYNFFVPENTTSKNYTLNMVIYYNDQDDSNSYSYNIEVLPGRCKQITAQVYAANATKEIFFSTNQMTSAFVGSQFLTKVDITNMNNITTDYIILAKDYSNWSTLNSITPTFLTLSPGQTSSVYIALTPLSNAQSTNAFKVSVASGTSVKDQTVTVSLQNSSQPSSFWDQIVFEFNRQWWLFAINIILFIGIIILLIAVFRPKKRSFPAAEIRLRQARNGNGKKK